LDPAPAAMAVFVFALSTDPEWVSPDLTVRPADR
jgi:hypothetical protein